MSSSDPLAALQDVSQDFPKYSAAIARKVEIPQSIAYKAMDLGRRGAETPGIYINGKVFRDKELNAYSYVPLRP
jgi:UDP-glucose:glycoprotein glucosyltransferase